MSSRVVFLSLFLGLASGMQSIDVQTDAAVKLVRIVLAGREIAALTQPPWHTVANLGTELDPRPIEAIGYDENGNELGRAQQILNLPRPPAELEIVLQYGDRGPKAVELRWRHLTFTDPKNVNVYLDTVPLKLDKNFRARLPEVDWLHPHLIAAEIKFRDGVVARREIVSGGAAVSDTAQSELTPILLTQNAAPQPPSFENCLSLDGQPVRTAAVEKPGAQVIFVREPDPQEAIRALDPTHQMRNSFFDRGAILHNVALDSDTSTRILWPIPKRIADRGNQFASLLFPSTSDFKASTLGLIWVLTRDYNGHHDHQPMQLADAVAVAGLRTITEGQRRAVVLILTSRPDASGRDPQSVRRYLATVGVPLFVWSLRGPVSSPWGEVEDVSSAARLREAADRLRAKLAAQRIAWVGVDPLEALRLRADARCGFETVARPR